MAKKMKKYQGDAGSSSVNVKAANDNATREAQLRNQLIANQLTRDIEYAKNKATSDAYFKSALDALKLEQQKRKQQSKKAGGATTKPITDLGMVDKMYKAKYNK